VLEDLLEIGEGLDIVGHTVSADETGPASGRDNWGPIVGVVRERELIHFDDPRAAELHEGDRVITLRSHTGGTLEPPRN
jgi:hypothetical protein